jgi:hypothetical protein
MHCFTYKDNNYKLKLPAIVAAQLSETQKARMFPRLLLCLVIRRLFFFVA